MARWKLIEMRVISDSGQVCSMGNVKIARFGALNLFLSPESRFAVGSVPWQNLFVLPFFDAFFCSTR